VTLFLDVALLTFLVAIAVAIVRIRDLFAVSMLFGMYSMLSASLFVTLDATDVAMTEAAVGAGMSTLFMLVTLSIVGQKEQVRPRRAWLALVVVTITGAVLAYGLLDLPLLGEADAPAHGRVAQYYLRQTAIDTDIPNVVTAVLASYRGYDTLGETAVIFIAGLGVLALLGLRPRKSSQAAGDQPTAGHTVLRVVGKILLPMILLFALYVQAHGDFSPGGGFQAGVIFATGFAVYALVFGARRARRAVPDAWVERGIALGLLVYGGVGIATLWFGGNFLDYDVLAASGVAGQHLGILVIELGVGLTVASVLVSILFTFADLEERTQP
jgi:multicomponent Na+:H+ antiporter subunit B